MSARDILLLRHGLTDANAANIIQGHQDVPLNEMGRAQALRLAGRIASYRPKVDVLVTSDLLRAEQTALPIAEACGLPLHFDAAWRERYFGPWEGRRMTHEQIWRIVTGEEEPEGAERSPDFTSRVQSALYGTIEKHDGVVAVVTHGGPIRSVLRMLADGTLAAAEGSQRPEVAAVPNCSILHLTVDDWRFAVLCVNDVAHLDEQTSQDAG